MMSKEKPDINLLTFYDDFIEFNDYCAFLCDSLSALFSEYTESETDNHTLQGIKRHCNDLKDRSEKLENILDTLYQQSYIDSKD